MSRKPILFWAFDLSGVSHVIERRPEFTYECAPALGIVTLEAPKCRSMSPLGGMMFFPGPQERPRFKSEFARYTACEKCLRIFDMVTADTSP